MLEALRTGSVCQQALQRISKRRTSMGGRRSSIDRSPITFIAFIGEPETRSPTDGDYLTCWSTNWGVTNDYLGAGTRMRRSKPTLHEPHGSCLVLRHLGNHCPLQRELYVPNRSRSVPRVSGNYIKAKMVVFHLESCR